MAPAERQMTKCGHHKNLGGRIAKRGSDKSWTTEFLYSEWRLIVFQIFERYVILGDLSRVNFSHVRIWRVLHAADRFSLEGLALLEQFFDALRVCFRDIRQSLGVPGLAG